MRATAVLIALLIASCAKTGENAPDFTGFPPINKLRPGERTAKVITSDGVTGLLRPKWTRAMGDLGGWPALYRFKDAIYLVYPHVDGHRTKAHEGTGRLLCFASKDEGRTWQAMPDQPPNHDAPQFVPLPDKLFRYDFSSRTQTQLRTSVDGINWSDAQNVYQRPFWMWGVTYDAATQTFWAPPHAIPSKDAPGERQIHLIKSKDGIAWEYVSTVSKYEQASESTLHLEPDGTMVVLIRRKYSKTDHSFAVAKPPYTEWTVTERPPIVEGERFFTIAGQTFLTCRALFQEKGKPEITEGIEIKEIMKSMAIHYPPYSVIYRFTKDKQLKPFAIMDSMGDCSYGTLVETPSEILCAYYSQHQDNVCKVYLCAYDKAEFLKE